MFMATLFIIDKEYKQLKYPSTDEQLGKSGNICPMEYYSAIKKDKVPIHATTWMDLINIILRDRSQTHRLNIM